MSSYVHRALHSSMAVAKNHITCQMDMKNFQCHYFFALLNLRNAYVVVSIVRWIRDIGSYIHKNSPLLPQVFWKKPFPGRTTSSTNSCLHTPVTTYMTPSTQVCLRKLFNKLCQRVVPADIQSLMVAPSLGVLPPGGCLVHYLSINGVTYVQEKFYCIVP